MGIYIIYIYIYIYYRFGTHSNVVVLAATNRKDILDPALLRPGRFDRCIDLNLPSLIEREAIFKVHLRKIRLSKKYKKSEYAKKLATLTPGLTGADIANICNEAAIITARGNEKAVSMNHFDAAIERVIAGLKRKMLLTQQERRIIAHHEAGHAVASWFLEYSNPLLKVFIYIYIYR